MNYPFNLDELGAAMDDFKAAVLGDVAEAHREYNELLKAAEKMARLLVLRVAEVKALETALAVARNKAADLENANTGLKRTIEELLRRPDLEEAVPDVYGEYPEEEDPQTLAEIARELGWI